MRYKVRPYKNSDISSLLQIYRASIKHLGPTQYTTNQTAVWSDYFKKIKAFEEWITSSKTFVAYNNKNECLGFGGLETKSRISSLFVSPKAMRKGVGSTLLRHLINEAIAEGTQELTTETSEFSKPLFEKFGFKVKEIEQTEIKGIKFERYAMQLRFSETSLV